MIKFVLVTPIDGIIFLLRLDVDDSDGKHLFIQNSRLLPFM